MFSSCPSSLLQTQYKRVRLYSSARHASESVEHRGWGPFKREAHSSPAPLPLWPSSLKHPLTIRRFFCNCSYTFFFLPLVASHHFNCMPEGNIIMWTSINHQFYCFVSFSSIITTVSPTCVSFTPVSVFLLILYFSLTFHASISAFQVLPLLFSFLIIAVFHTCLFFPRLSFF